MSMELVSPRLHIWTFAAGLDEMGTQPYYNCPCNNGGTAFPTLFLENDYFCETAAMATNGNTDDPLWDGAGCGPQSTCCSFNNPPWFYKQLPQPTTDSIEMRLCRNDPVSNEDVVIEIIELYEQ